MNEAASLLMDGYHRGNITSSVNLGYMVRRHEVVPEHYPLLDALFKDALLQHNSFAIVNEALRKAAGIQCDMDWHAADDMIASLRGTAGVEWWVSRSRAGDPEGDLVLGWLVRHGLTSDPDELGAIPGLSQNSCVHVDNPVMDGELKCEM